MTEFDQDTYLGMLRLEDKYARPPSVWEVSMSFPDCRAIAARHAYDLALGINEAMGMAGDDVVLKSFVTSSPAHKRYTIIKTFLNHTRPRLERKELDIAGAKMVPIQSLYDFHKARHSSGRIHAVCPFHDEKLPSMVIYKRNNTFHCFGCQKGGTAIDFIMHLHGKSFKDAVNYLNSHQ